MDCVYPRMNEMNEESIDFFIRAKKVKKIYVNNISLKFRQERYTVFFTKLLIPILNLRINKTANKHTNVYIKFLCYIGIKPCKSLGESPLCKIYLRYALEYIIACVS